MIGWLRGRVVDDDPSGMLLLETGGVGYEVLLPLGTRGRLTLDESGNVGVWVHTNVREDALELFGFESKHQRTAFRVLIGLPNVGPKLALSVLGSVSVADLATIVARGELGKLTAIPGVGKKTAERLLLELKGKLDAGPGPAMSSASPVAVQGGKAELLASALTRMGFRPAESERAIASLASQEDLETAPMGDLMRKALALLSR